MNDQVSHPLAMEFHRARLGALRAAIDDLVRHRPQSYLASADAAAPSTIRGPLAGCLKSAPIYQIISQPARYEDLDRLLMPQASKPAPCRSGNQQALIELYQVAETYFVKDGNRRVTEARARGQLFLLAHVTEYQIDGSPDQPADLFTQLLVEEYREFQALTGLAQIRPAQQIACTALGGYAALLRQIESLRAELAARQGYAIDRQAAVAQWYDQLYQPITAVLRRQYNLEQLPRRSETDLYLWSTRLVLPSLSDIR
ncbi:MAG TPA: hypothetical protein VFU22_23695 [Roseiflexaceae bacterium]|nr:hypothetical protein [Roseiflexaceae bacterium]